MFPVDWKLSTHGLRRIGCVDVQWAEARSDQGMMRGWVVWNARFDGSWSSFLTYHEGDATRKRWRAKHSSRLLRAPHGSDPESSKLVGLNSRLE